MTTYRLHYFPESGNSYKLALMLALCGETFEPVWTDFGSGVTFTREWRATVNAMGEIPVLEDDGVKLTQTAPTLLRLAERYGRLGASGEDARFELLRWLFWDNGKLSSMLATYRYFRAFTERSDLQVQKYLKRRVDDCLRVLEGHVSSRAFILGEDASVADVSACAYLSFPPDESGYDLAQSHPAIHAWLGRIADLPGWKPPYDLLPGQRLRKYV